MQEAKAELQTATAKLARAEAALEANAKSIAELDEIRLRLNELLGAKSKEEEQKLVRVTDGLERQQAALERQQAALRADRDVALARVRELEQRRDALMASVQGRVLNERVLFMTRIATPVVALLGGPSSEKRERFFVNRIFAWKGLQEEAKQLGDGRTDPVKGLHDPARPPFEVTSESRELSFLSEYVFGNLTRLGYAHYFDERTTQGAGRPDVVASDERSVVFLTGECKRHSRLAVAGNAEQVCGGVCAVRIIFPGNAPHCGPVRRSEPCTAVLPHDAEPRYMRLPH